MFEPATQIPPAPGPTAPVRPRRRWASGVRGLGLALFALAGVVLFFWLVNDQYAVSKWLFWIYARVWLWTLACGAGCLSVGYLVTKRLAHWTAPLREQLLISFAVGAFIFSTGVFAVGLLHGLGPIFFVAWPAVLFAAGARPLLSTMRRARRLLPRARRLAAPPPWWGGVVLVFGVAGMSLLYVNILTPSNAAFDSRWYHLAIAEHYAAAGAVTRFPEGWFNGTYPHLASFFYTWALLLPGADLFTRIELAAHLEFLLFLATLSGVAILARWCAGRGGVRMRNGWAALFLFPGILLYDSSLSIAADHVLAFWAPPIFLLFRRLFKSWDPLSAALLGLTMAGAIMTKYQAVYLLALPGVALLIRAAQMKWGARRFSVRRALAPLLVLGGATLVLTTPLWLKNWIWYGDPVYPMLGNLFPRHPWVASADPNKFLELTSWTPQGPLLDRLRQTLLATVTFSFIPHDWWNHHGSVPVFGSLFTLTLPLLLFVRPRKRLLALALATMVGIAIWYWTYHQDRYLQALLPWMAAVVAGILALAWREGWGGRLAVAALVAAQLVWGGDVYTFPTHGMLSTQPAKLVLDLVSSGFRKEWAAHSESHMDLAPVAPLLPKRSKVLIHERLVHFGLGAMSVADIPGTQAGISYASLASPQRVYRLLRRFGVTHLLWSRGYTQKNETAADDLVFFEFAEKYTRNQVPVAGFILAEMPPDAPPEVAEPRLVRLQLCGSARTVLLPQVDAAVAGAPQPDGAGAGPPAFYVVQSGCAAIPPESAGAYRSLLIRDGYELWALKSP